MNIPCPICQFTEAALIFSASSWERIENSCHKVFKCLNCNCVFTDSSIPPETLNAYYESGLYRNVRNRLSWLMQSLSAIFQEERLAKVRRAGNGNRILDVGCGKGRFLEYAAEHGWDVSGIEPSTNGRVVARSRLGERVFADLEEVEGEIYDVVTLWHVLEHLSAPLETLTRLRPFLHPAGWLLIAVPNFASIQARLGKQKWAHLDVPRHRVHYTPETLRNTLEKAGYEVVYVDHYSLETNVIGMYQSIFNVLGVEPNLVYKLVKRNFSAQRAGYVRFLLNLFIFIVGTPFILPLSLVLTVCESVFGKGGTILAYARLSYQGSGE